MEGNKDDALKSLKLGKEALDGGDRVRALKFLNKACRLDPTLAIDNLLSAAAAAAYNYTEEQITMVKHIMKKKDYYYEILGLKKTCSVEDVRKAYRKLSLKVHPDKNRAPGSEEAFKAISKAFQCLSNEETRKTYERATSYSSSSTMTAGADSYTEEQIMIVKQIMRKKDYYEILGLKKTCCIEDVRKAYQTLYLKVHPDNNKAPLAEEAFKKVSEAFQSLINEERRKKPVFYEMRASACCGGGGNGFNCFYDSGFEATTENYGTGMGVNMGDQGSTGFSHQLFFFLLYFVVLFFLFIRQYV